MILPAALGYVALALPISRLLFEHGHAQLVDARLIASTLRAFAVGLPFFSTFQLLTRTFYAMQDTRTPALVSFVRSASMATNPRPRRTRAEPLSGTFGTAVLEA